MDINDKLLERQILWDKKSEYPICEKSLLAKRLDFHDKERGVSKSFIFEERVPRKLFAN